jgi:SAM-dependent methyltransferase
MYTRAGGKGPVSIRIDDIKRLIEEIAYDGSSVDTVLVCVNAQVMYYPSKVGTLRGTLSSSEERANWPDSQRQLFENLARFYESGVDPYAVLLAEAKRRGREALLTFRMNDDHGNDFLRTQFWIDHPEWRLGKGALDFGHDEVRAHVASLIEEAVRRYDCDGIELDFNRFPAFFTGGTTAERTTKMNQLVQRIRNLLNAVGHERGRRLVLGVRAPSNFGRTPPTPESCRQLGCDVVTWANNGWLDFVTVSEFLYTRYDLPIKPWKEVIRNVPVYGGIECTEGGSKEQYLTADKYRRAAWHLRNDGADGVYLFNFFTTREYGQESWEPPFEVLRDLTAVPLPANINAAFLDPNLKPAEWVERFEVESREIFASRLDIVRAMELSAGKSVADIGTGTGLFLKPFSEVVGERGKVYAVDISPRLIEFAKERVKRENLTNVEVKLSKIDSTDLAEASVDIAFVCDTYHHFEDHAAMLQSIRTALRPGGDLVVIDFERIPGKSRPWVLDHVRGDKSQFRSEIEQAGFAFIGEARIPGLHENYFLKFRKR